jgi:hypothetical protein
VISGAMAAGMRGEQPQLRPADIQFIIRFSDKSADVV